MERSNLYLHMLDTTAKLQHEIALILEAKVVEAEKSRNWICGHLNATNLIGHDDQMKQSGAINEKVIELIEGITKMENALNRQLQALLRQNEAESSGNGGFGGLMSFGGSEQ